MIHFISMVFIVMTLNSHKYHHNHHWHRNHHHCHEIIIIMVIIMVIMGDDSDKVFFPSHISLTVQQGTPSSFTAATNRCDDETWSPSSPNVYHFVMLIIIISPSHCAEPLWIFIFVHIWIFGTIFAGWPQQHTDGVNHHRHPTRRKKQSSRSKPGPWSDMKIHKSLQTCKDHS